MKNRKPNRWYSFDYTANAKYFITLCNNDRTPCFGNITNDEMVLNAYGQIVSQQIDWLSAQYSYLKIHNSVVMPNHIHLLFEITSAQLPLDEMPNVGNDYLVDTTQELSAINDSSQHAAMFKIKSVSELMGAFKTTSSKKLHLAGQTTFKWQRSFYDHVVRNHESYSQIYNYITQNPAKWSTDTFNNPDIIGRDMS